MSSLIIFSLGVEHFHYFNEFISEQGFAVEFHRFCTRGFDIIFQICPLSISYVIKGRVVAVILGLSTFYSRCIWQPWDLTQLCKNFNTLYCRCSIYILKMHLVWTLLYIFLFFQLIFHVSFFLARVHVHYLRNLPKNSYI